MGSWGSRLQTGQRIWLLIITDITIEVVWIRITERKQSVDSLKLLGRKLRGDLWIKKQTSTTSSKQWIIFLFSKQMDTSSLYKQHLQKLYNQNTVVEDSELTSFCYLKTLVMHMRRRPCSFWSWYLPRRASWPLYMTISGTWANQTNRTSGILLRCYSRSWL